MKCRILKIQRPGMVALYQPQYKGWIFWHNIPMHREGGVAGVRRTRYYYSVEEAEKGLKDYFAKNSLLTCEVEKEYEL